MTTQAAAKVVAGKVSAGTKQAYPMVLYTCRQMVKWTGTTGQLGFQYYHRSWWTFWYWKIIGE